MLTLLKVRVLVGAVSGFFRIVPMVLGPRGRCDRKGLLVLMLVTLFLQALMGAAIFGLGFSFTEPFALTIKLAFVWVAISASIQRLHDTGRTGWLLLVAIVGLLVWMSIWGAFVPLFIALQYGVEHVQLYSPLFFVFLAISYVPLVGCGLWLHVKKGDPAANRFGPVPDASGFSKRSAVVVPRDDRAAEAVTA